MHHYITLYEAAFAALLRRHGALPADEEGGATPPELSLEVNIARHLSTTVFGKTPSVCMRLTGRGADRASTYRALAMAWCWTSLSKWGEARRVVGEW